mgnify:FL=1
MFTRARAPGLWILGSVVSPAELEHLDDYSLAIDGDAGGTYAPSAAIVIGGSGVTFSGANHHVSGTLTVDNLAVISIADGGTVKAEGSGGADITLSVVSNVATMSVGSGAVAKILAGGALDVYGALTLKDTSGPGSITAEDHTTITLASGATLAAASGSTVSLTGTTDVRGNLTLKASGGPGALIQEAGTTTTLNGSTAVGAAATITYATGATIAGLQTRTGGVLKSGSAARTIHRPAALLADADADVTVASDTVRVRQTITATHVYTLRHTGTVPQAGERINAYRSGTTLPSATYAAQFKREDGTEVFTFYALKQGWATFEFDGSDWQLIAWAQFDAADLSGSYGDVW